ncbi:MAG: beta-galactosidase [Micromonosporaceae bacterium]|nr:beta-galactosidase [Micromonosporaceae bacterium]
MRSRLAGLGTFRRAARRWSPLWILTILVALAPAGAAAQAAAPPGTTALPPGTTAPPGTRTHTVTFDHYSLLIDGRRTYLWSGEFHYWRLPSPDLWRDVLQKMKAAGFNATSIYFDWGYHSPKPGVYDFTGVRDVDRLLDIAAEVGIYVIARPGPYINAETDAGGFPGWLVTQQGRARSSAADFQAASDEWLHHIDPIIARHQLTNGTGTVILYQIENEYGSNGDPAYMEHTEQVVREDGITVPLTHNYCCGPSTWATGRGAVDIPGQDSYPQGFNCSNPTRWNPAGTLPRFRDDAPIFTPEFQGGSFDPWGGPGYDRCRQLTGPDFEKVFYKNNIAGGATMQSFYMTYGGTSWGWLADPQQVYTSYDYGAPIKEDRELTTKYDEDKRLGYFVQTVAPLTKTEVFASAPPTNPSIVEQARINPDDHTQFLELQHADTTSTARDQTHIAVDLGARSSYTYDDRDPALQYTGAWSHVGAEQSYTAGDYLRTESFSDAAGDSVTVSFTGTSVRWVSSKDANHGIADVYLDGVKVATVDGYGPSKVYQQVFYAADGLPDGPHTLTITATGTRNPAATGTFVVVDAIDVPPPGSTFYPSVPQQPGTAITLDGRDAKLLVANYAMGDQRLVYSTSEIMTHARIGSRDVALLYGRDGQDGETVLRYPAEPQVRVLAGQVQSTWDADRHDLRLNYTHQGLAEVLVTPHGGTPLLLLLATDEVAAQFWRQDTTSGPVLVRGPYLVRTAGYARGTLALTGDTAQPTPVSVFAAAPVTSLQWNGKRVAAKQVADGSLAATLPGPAPVTLPALQHWRYRAETNEADPAFDDGRWRLATNTTTNNPTAPAAPPVLYTDEYGFHHGDVWYRGHFRGHGDETGVTLTAITGRAGVYAVWLNGQYLGSSDSGTHRFEFPPGSVRAGSDNVLAVLVENMGHNEDFNADDSHKQPRGLTSAAIIGSSAQITWRIQGSLGGEDLVDPVRGPMNVGGLYGERNGWHLPGYPDSGWSTVALPHSDTTPGVAWYRTTVALDLPKGRDIPIGIKISDDPARHYRALIFVNGWQVGRYLNDVGPQRSFPVPTGILRPNGTNTIAIAVWSLDGTTGGLGQVSLEAYANLASSLTVSDVPSPRYDPHTYQTAPSTADVVVAAPDVIARGQSGTVTVTFSNPANRPPAESVALRLAVPDGWTAAPADTTATYDRVQPGRSVTATWTVTAPAGDQPAAAIFTATATYRQAHRPDAAAGAATVRVPPPAPTGTVYVSDLPFTSTNGWGPVERDTSNGENQAGDGHPITLNGTVYAKGLGVHAIGDVTVYLGGACSRFTAVVGVDDEVGGGGSVTFTVLADGEPVAATPVLTGNSASVPIDADLTGAQQLDLVIGDGGNGNGSDHGDWADAKLVCD